MSTPLHVAVEIITAVSKSTENHSPLDVNSVAREISQRHPRAGFDLDAIAAALAEEGRAAGKRIVRRRFSGPSETRLS